MDNNKKYVPYHITKEIKLDEKLEKQLELLPNFSKSFFREMSRFENKASSTLIAYATDLRIFFTWAKEYLPEYSEYSMKEIPINILTKLHVSDIKSFMIDYIPHYTTLIKINDNSNVEYKEVKRKNSKTTSARKLSTLKKFYHYYNNLSPDEQYYITNDPVSSIKQSKDIAQPIKYLDDNETKALFTCIDSGEGLDGKSKKWNETTRERDRAIIALFLGTGIRVSELAGINIQDVNFDDNSIKIFRKERRTDTVYMPQNVADALLSYINGSRIPVYKPNVENENALFLSFKHNRMSVSAIERCVKKYTQIATGDSGYSCHKLRDTFGTRIYAETGGNAKKVQTAMNHKSASTSLDYYVAAIEGKEKEDTFKKTHIEGL